ncbi:MAG: hypothetical protein U0401_15120 [Anaerolineae bacterium]
MGLRYRTWSDCSFPQCNPPILPCAFSAWNTGVRHQSWWQQWRSEDEVTVNRALTITGRHLIFNVHKSLLQVTFVIY